MADDHGPGAGLTDRLLDYCLGKPGAFLDFPFGPDVTVVKVKAPSQDRGPIFLQLFELRGDARATFRCTPEDGQYLRSTFPGRVVRGYHCQTPLQPYANTVTLDGVVPDDLLFQMADDSWSLMVAKLPGWARHEVLSCDRSPETGTAPVEPEPDECTTRDSNPEPAD
ncbi:hypothetical protein GCM10009785_03710 [Brooklawnia cerclae]|uniref:MmcQ/YjbR family DNA-binding protein n=1 Tax=Brooklawnia cerclae TaxID=349934 RepID=UPI001422E5A3